MSLLPFWPKTSSAALGAGSDAVSGTSSDGVPACPDDMHLVFDATPDAPLLVEANSAQSAAAHRDAWADLVSRSLEPNVFSEPSFQLTAAQHFAPARRPIFVMVWALRASGSRDLLAVCPLTRSRNPLNRTTAVWFHDLCTLGAPLLDRQYAGVALQAILAWVAGRLPGTGAFLVHALPAEGPTARILGQVASATGRRIRWLDRRQRAALKTGGEAGASGLDAASPKRAKEFGRQRRRLAERGDVQYLSVRDHGLREAVEGFLLLEARGWKGRQGTALLADTSRAAFARTMTRLLAREGKCRVDSLTLDQVPVASGIILSSGGRDFFWKMAYDEEFSSMSPGVQFVLDLTQAQRSAPDLELTDSCAVPDHPMIDRLWPDRLALFDAFVAVAPGVSPRFAAELAFERSRRKAKSSAKRMIAALRTIVSRLRSRGPG